MAATVTTPPVGTSTVVAPNGTTAVQNSSGGQTLTAPGVTLAPTTIAQPANPAAVMTPQDELNELNSNPSYGGGQYYGRVPNGVADLVNGGIVDPTQPSPYVTPSQSNVTPTVPYITDQTTPNGQSPANAGQPITEPGSDGSIASTIASSGVSRYTGSVAAPTAPDENAIRASALADAQNEIAGIQAQYAPLVQQAEDVGTENMGKTRAAEARGGLIGSDFGESDEGNTQNTTDANVQKVNDAMNTAISNAITKAQARGDTLVKAADDQYNTSESQYLDTLKTSQTDARADVASLAKGGIPLSSLTPDEYNTLLAQSGYDPGVFQAVYNANMPAAVQTKYTYEKLADGSFLPISVDPTTGQPVAGPPIVPPSDGQTYDQFTVAPDGTPLFINKTTGTATVANVAGTSKTNFSKPAAGTSGTKTAAETAADSVGSSWLKQQPDYSAAYLNAYNTDPVFHAAVNAAAAAAVKPKSTASTSTLGFLFDSESGVGSLSTSTSGSSAQTP